VFERVSLVQLQLSKTIIILGITETTDKESVLALDDVCFLMYQQSFILGWNESQEG
jgi:hypothetical protein